MICFSILSCPFLMAAMQESPIENWRNDSYNDQDRESLASGNPLKGLNKYSFSSRFFATKTLADKINSIAETELKRIGTVDKKQMIVESDKGKSVDLSGFNLGSMLIYEIKNVTDLNGKELGFVRASLNLSAPVLIETTKKQCSSYIWSCNCFLEGDVNKNLETLVSKSLNYLLNQFRINYTSVNSDKPVFNF